MTATESTVEMTVAGSPDDIADKLDAVAKHLNDAAAIVRTTIPALMLECPQEVYAGQLCEWHKKLVAIANESEDLATELRPF